MKYFFRITFLIILMSACTKGTGNDGQAIPKATALNFFPLSIGNQWKYNSTRHLEADSTSLGNYTLTVIDSSHQFDTPSYSFKTAPDLQTTTSLAGILAGGFINKVEGRIIFNGNFPLQIPPLNGSISIPIQNLILTNQNVRAGQTLSSIHGSVEYPIIVNGEHKTGTFDYNLATKAGEDYKDFEGDKTDFKNVISTKVNLSLTIILQEGETDESYPLVDQEVWKTTLYFAENVGYIYEENELAYHFRANQGLDSLLQRKDYMEKSTIKLDSFDF